MVGWNARKRKTSLMQGAKEAAKAYRPIKPFGDVAPRDPCLTIGFEEFDRDARRICLGFLHAAV